MAREAPHLYLSDHEADQLRRLAQAHSTPQALAFRARLILRCSQTDHPRNDHVAVELACDADTVSKWRRRFQRQRLDGLHDLPRSGRPPAFSPGGSAQGSVPGHQSAAGAGRAHDALVAR